MDISAIGRQFGLDDEQTRAALDALVPVVAAGMRRTAQSPEGLQEVLRQVLTGGYGGSLDDDRAVSFERAKPAGDEVLGQIFGDKQVSREVAQQLSATSGVGAAILKKLLPIVATMVLGTLAKRMGSGGAMAGERVPQPRSDGGGGGLGDILRDVLGGGGPVGGGQAAPQQVPQPQPMPEPRQGGGGSLEDVLGDILSGGGGQGRVVVKQIHPIRWATFSATFSAAICRAAAEASTFRRNAGHRTRPSRAGGTRSTIFSDVEPAAAMRPTICSTRSRDRFAAGEQADGLGFPPWPGPGLARREGNLLPTALYGLDRSTARSPVLRPARCRD